MQAELRVVVENDSDIVDARQKGRQLAAANGFSSTDQTLIATAISEIARNIVTYAQRGEVELGVLQENGRTAIVVVARDQGPGIADTDLAMRDGYSTQKSLGVGLPGARRLMDEFELVSAPGKGTAITMKKWRR